MGMKPRPAQTQDLKKASDKELFEELITRGYLFGMDRGPTQMFKRGDAIVPYHAYGLMVPATSWFTKNVEENS